MYLLTEWESLKGKYLARGHGFDNNACAGLYWSYDKTSYISLVNTRMRSKRDIKKGRLCTRDGGVV